jgi:glycosyltransferase involved in cell wall biosynthesis
MPWVLHQFSKCASSYDELVVIDSSERPASGLSSPRKGPSSCVRVVHRPDLPGIAAKRTVALQEASRDIITWFDDDDWQAPSKLSTIENVFYISSEILAVGSRKGRMYSTLTGKMGHYTSRYEPIIFNSAGYRLSAVPKHFEVEMLTGEDTEWHSRFFANDPTFLVLREQLSAWLCHTKNITNKSSSRFFEYSNNIPFDDWELKFLKGLRV